MGVVTKLTKRISTANQDDLLEAAERELGELRAAIERHHAEAQRLAADWLHAASQDAAEQFDKQRREALRLIERDTARIPELETRVVAAKAERQREALARHIGVMRTLFPKLRDALTLAASVQNEVFRARQEAVAEFTEGVCAIHLPHLHYRGFVVDDLVQLWAAEQERVWSAKPKTAPRPVAAPAPAKALAPKPPIAAPPVPPLVRPRRQDPPPAEGQASIVFLRPGTELPDGTAARIGDRCNLPVEQARALIMQGAADYALTETR